MMLASTPNLLQMCSFDTTKSTKGASKLRRDLINSEIANLRDLLPLPSSTRQRLSQLQLMALVCVYVRKANYFQYAFRKQHELLHPHHHHHHPHQFPTTNFGFSKALSGFLMMMTQNGKLLYISDNAAEYLGHSMEDLLIHGDSVYDIIEKQDHQTIQNELMRASNPLLIPDTRIFLCRMNVSRNSRRQMRFGDQKVVLVQGHFVSYLPLCSRNEPVFLATCTPVAMPETRECVVQGSTNVFTSIHSMDMKFIHLDSNGEFYLGYNKNQLKNLSWYDICHWDNLKEAQSKHRLIIQSEQERSCILLLRLQTSSMQWIWVHVVLQVKDNNENSQQPVIVCTNQVLSDKEAEVMQANGWLYQFYSLHSKMHYMQNQTATSSSTNNGTVSPSPSNVSVTNSTTSSSNYTTDPTTATTTTTSTNNRSYSNNFNNSSSASPISTTSFLASEPPSLAIHPTHPSTNTTNNISSTYYSNSNGGNISACLNSTSTYHQQYSSSLMMSSQYSPQAGTLPYQTATTTNNQTDLTQPNTPPASQTEHRIKQEEQQQPVAASNSTTTTTTTRTKRSRSSNNVNGNANNTAPESKRNKKKTNNNNLNTTTSTSSSTATTETNSMISHHQDHLAPYGSSSYKNMTTNTWNHGTGVYQTATTGGSMFASTAPSPADHLSPMITPTAAAAAAAAAYYGGTSYHHHHHSHHTHPHHHQMAAYTSHFNSTTSHHHSAANHHHQTSKPFSFLEHETANVNHHHNLHYNNSSSSSTLTSGGVNSQSNSTLNGHRSQRNESSTLVSSAFSNFSTATPTTTTSTNFQSSKLRQSYQSANDSISNSNDRRDLDKVRSPESITSATSDYGSMTSQSPPSSFEKPSTFSTLVSTSSTIQDSPNFETYGTHSNNHHSSPYQPMKNQWPQPQPISETSTIDPITNASTFHTAFPRLSTFQFWPGYSPAAAATTNTTNGGTSDLMSVGHHPSQYHHQHYHHDRHPHHPHLASTFPSMDTLIHHQTYGAGHHHSTNGHLFTPYHGTSSTTDCLSTNHYHHETADTSPNNEKTNLVNSNGRSKSSNKTDASSKLESVSSSPPITSKQPSTSTTNSVTRTL